jgi:hypothetical protein
MRRKKTRFASRFDHENAHDPVTSLGNLVDVMLVVACGLAAALVAAGTPSHGASPAVPRGEEAREVVRGREIPEPPSVRGRGGPSYVPVGRVFRDPRTGALVLVDEAPSTSETQAHSASRQTQ